MTPPAPARPYRPLPACPVCGGPAGETVFAADAVPVLCNALHDSADEARRAPVGSIDLVLCPSCGLLWNAAFDEAIVAYTPAYENSLHFSPEFQRFATGLAADLVARWDLGGRTVLEVGSGKGDFLAMLCDAGAGLGIGFDPSYAGETPARPDLRFEPTLFPEESFPEADFVCARHVFEHLPAPARVLGRVRAAIPPGRTVGFYVEVPDGTYLLRQVALWDVIYEHPLHYTAPALARLFEGAGLAVARIATSFGGQYLSAEGTTGPVAAAADGGGGADLPRLAAAFGERTTGLRAAWSRALDDLAGQGPVALWGAGSKGVSFLATVPGAEAVEAVVDVNPRKHGRFLPGSGRRVVAPDALAALRPRAVVVLNPVYRDEIAAMLDGLGVGAEVVTEPPA